MKSELSPLRLLQTTPPCLASLYDSRPRFLVSLTIKLSNKKVREKNFTYLFKTTHSLVSQLTKNAINQQIAKKNYSERTYTATPSNNTERTSIETK